MKLATTFLALAVSSCLFVPMYPHASDEDVESGALIQGSKNWNDRNSCGSDETTGICVRVLEGPVMLDEIKTSLSCANDISIAIKETWGNGELGRETYWALTSNGTPLWVRGLVISEGQSLFIGTVTSNFKEKNGSCYITWTGKKI